MQHETAPWQVSFVNPHELGPSVKRLLAALLPALLLTFIAPMPAANSVPVGVQMAPKKSPKPPAKVQQTSIKSQPRDVTLTEGGTAKFSVSAVGSNLRYEWQIKHPQSKIWYYFQRGPSNTGNLTQVAPSESGSQIRALVTGSKGYAYTKSVKLTVKRAAKPSVTKVSQGKSDFNKAVTVKVSGKNFNDVHTVSYSGWQSGNLRFTKTSTTISVTLPREQVPTTATLVVRSAAGYGSVQLERARLLDSNKRKAYVNKYNSLRRTHGDPKGNVRNAVSTALRYIQSYNAWDNEAWSSSLIIEHGFRYRQLEKRVENLQKQADALSKKSKHGNKCKSNNGKGKGNVSCVDDSSKLKELQRQISSDKKLMNDELSEMRSLGARV